MTFFVFLVTCFRPEFLAVDAGCGTNTDAAQLAETFAASLSLTKVPRSSF
jgi:hypothetical protein